jgi:hypothetical protein
MAVDPFGNTSTATAGPASTEAEDFLTGGTTVVAAKWPKVGHMVEGTIIDWQMAQKTDMDSGELQWFEGKKLVKDSELKRPDTARPAMQMLLDLQCEATGITWETNQYIEKPVPDDDGVRRAYISGELQKALGEAIKAANGKLEKGAYVEIVRMDPKKMPSGFYAYTYRARWTPAAQNTKAGTDFLTKPEDKDDNPFA